MPLFILLISTQSWQAEVNLAIDRGIEHVISFQRASGDFPVGYSNDYPTGPAALGVYALLKSGLPADDPVIRRALAFLKPKPFKKVYATAVLIMALDALKDPSVDPWIQRAAAFLESCHDKRTKLWGYPDGTPELSNTQFAVMGLWLAEKHGYKTKAETWKKVLRATIRLQNRDGGFGYRFNMRPESCGSMTTAGITVLAIAAEVFDGTPIAQGTRKPLARAWAWFDKVFTATGNPRGAGGVIKPAENRLWYTYYLYGLERIAAFAKRKRIAGRDWYREGAIELLKQEQNGSWSGFENTCFALLFLRRATFTGLSGERRAGAAGAVTWRYTFARPPDGWTTPEFDDSGWKTGAGAFGKWAAGPVRTPWETKHIWIRRTAEKPFERLYVNHDDAAEVYVDGGEAHTLSGYSSKKYVAVEAEGTFVAAHGHNIDPKGVGILDIKFVNVGLRTGARGFLWWKDKPGKDVPLLDGWETKGPFADKRAERIWDPVPKSGAWSKGKLKAKDKSISYARKVLTITASVDAILWVGADDGFAVELDGKLIFAHQTRSVLKPDEHAVPLRLSKGEHTLVLRLVNDKDDTSFQARLTDRSGKPLRP